MCAAAKPTTSHMHTYSTLYIWEPCVRLPDSTVSAAYSWAQTRLEQQRITTFRSLQIGIFTFRMPELHQNDRLDEALLLRYSKVSESKRSCGAIGRRNSMESAHKHSSAGAAASQTGCFATRYSEIVRSEVPSEVGSMGGAVVGSEGGAGLAGEASRTAAATSETLVGDSGGAASEGEHSGGRPPDLSSGGRALCHACTMHRHPKCPLASALCIRKRSDRVDRL